MAEAVHILSTKCLTNAVKDVLPEHIHITEYNFIKTVPVNCDDQIKRISDQQVDLVFTSSKAVHYFLEAVHRNHLSYRIPNQVYCLSGETLKAVSGAGMDILGIADNAAMLAKKIIEDKPKRKLIFLCAEKRRDDLPELLKAAGIDLEEIIIYQTILQPVKVESTFTGILLFSPSAVESLFMMNKIDPSTVLFCIGETTASAVYKFLPEAKIISADKPHPQDLLRKVREYFSEKAVSKITE